MTIKHLSLCSGGIIGLVMYGALKRLNKLKFWELKNIESIYSCSVGAIIGLMIILDIKWDWLDDYWIKRPWKTIFNFDNIDYFKYINDKGLFDEDIWIKMFSPLFKCKNLKTDITLLELYNHTNIKFNLYITDMNNITKKQLNYITHPNMRVTQAIYITGCIPYISKPCFLDNNLYIDGGLTNNSPINDCIMENNCMYDEVLNFTNNKNECILFDIDKKYILNHELEKLIDCSNNKTLNKTNNNINILDNDKISDDKIGDDKTDDDNTGDDIIGGNKTDDDKTDDDKTSDDKTSNDKIGDDKTEHDKTDDDKTDDDKMGDDKIGDDKTGNDKTGYDKTSDDKTEEGISRLDLSINKTEISEMFDNEILENCNILQFSMYILKNLIKQFIYLNNMNNINIPNTINCSISKNSIDIKLWIDIIYDKHKINTCINYGEYLADNFYINKFNIDL